MYEFLNDIFFWSEYWMHHILPMVNYGVGMAFQSIITHRAIGLIHTVIVNYVNRQIESAGKY